MNVAGMVWSALAIASATVSGASAQPAPTPGPADTIAIEYLAQPSCPDEISLRAGIVARLGRDPFSNDAPRKAFIDVQSSAAGFVAVVELREQGRQPSRRAIGPTAKCEDAVAALELALAVIVDPSYGAPAEPYQLPYRPRPAPAAPASYEPPGWRGLPPPNQPRPPPKHELAFALGGVTGSHPGVASAILLRAAYLLPKYRIGVVGRLSHSSGQLEGSDDFTANVSESEVLAELCLRYEFLITCAAVGVGVKDVSIGDYSIQEPDRGAEYSTPFFEAAASAGVNIPLGRAFLRPTVEVSLPLPAVKIESLGVERYRVGLGQLAFDLALGYRW